MDINWWWAAAGAGAIGLGTLLARATRASAAVRPLLGKIQLPTIEQKLTTSMKATPAGTKRPINVLVIHTAEAHERDDGAENLAQYGLHPSYPSSWHYAVDRNSITQTVLDNNVAWAAPPRNDDGIHIELIGFAKQTAAEWDDAFSRDELELAARLVAAKAQEFDVPLVWLSPEDLLAGKRGVTSHANISKAYKKSDHTDPGPNFPVESFMARARAIR